MPTSSVTDRIRVVAPPQDGTAEGRGPTVPSLPAFEGARRAANVQSALAVSGLCKTYSNQGAKTPVLKDVSFAVQKGEAVAIVGANGSGKSTALRCALRLIEPSAGDIRLDGRSITGVKGRALRQVRARVGFVFQKHNLSTRMSVLSNVLQGGLARGQGVRAWSHRLAPAAEREKALACLDRVGLADLAGRRADRLSGGQSQRVAVARALMQEPAMLFADEPAASLDPKAGEDVMALFSDLRKRSGLTVVFVSHNLDHALAHADRLIGLQAGRVVLDRPTQGMTPDTLAWLYAAEDRS